MSNCNKKNRQLRYFHPASQPNNQPSNSSGYIMPTLDTDVTTNLSDSVVSVSAEDQSSTLTYCAKIAVNIVSLSCSALALGAAVFYSPHIIFMFSDLIFSISAMKKNAFNPQVGMNNEANGLYKTMDTSTANMVNTATVGSNSGSSIASASYCSNKVETSLLANRVFGVPNAMFLMLAFFEIVYTISLFKQLNDMDNSQPDAEQRSREARWDIGMSAIRLGCDLAIVFNLYASTMFVFETTLVLMGLVCSCVKGKDNSFNNTHENNLKPQIPQQGIGHFCKYSTCEKPVEMTSRGDIATKGDIVKSSLSVKVAI